MSHARKKLGAAEAIDGYLTACEASSVNEFARRGCLYSPFYISPISSQRLRAEIFKIPLLNGTDTIILHSTADNGFPHTRANGIVCIPDTYINNSTTEVLADTLRHEAMHIHQRQFPDLWKGMCRREGWTPIPTETLPKRFRDQCRINPDTMYDTPFWAWDSYHVPMPMFASANPGNLADVRIEWFDLRTGALFHHPPESFVKKYGSPSQPEHPYEIYAVKYAHEGISNHNALHIKLVTQD